MAGRNGADDFSFDSQPSGKADPNGSGTSSEPAGNGNGIGSVSGAIDPLKSRTDSINAGAEYTGTLNKDGSPRRKPGRKPGEQGPRRKADNPADLEAADVEGTAALLMAIHTVLAVNVPEMEMGEDEALKIAKAFDRVERHYPTIRRVLSTKVKDHVTFFSVVGTAYGSRIAAIRLRKTMELDSASASNAAQTINSTATPGPGHPDYGRK